MEELKTTENTKEILTKAQNAFELSELIDRIKYKNHKRTIHLLRMYVMDISSSKEAKLVLENLAQQVENRFSNLNKYRIWFIRFYEWF